MNRSQKIILITSAVIIAIMFLFPPWLFVFNPPKEGIYQPATRPAGYHLILSAHRPMDQVKLSEIFALGFPKVPLSVFTVMLDWRRLAVQVVGVLVVTILLTTALKAKK